MKGRTISDRELLFKDYTYTKMVYHIAPAIKLKGILDNGLKVSKSCSSKYDGFNDFFDDVKPDMIPWWVSRKNAIYGSLNFDKNHKWHSHSVVLSFRIDEERCWIGNENLANILYEPFALKDIDLFPGVKRFFANHGEQYALSYWKNSASFIDNLVKRYDIFKGYDAEVLIMHDIPPEDINIVKIFSDHRAMDVEQCDQAFSSLVQFQGDHHQDSL